MERNKTFKMLILSIILIMAVSFISGSVAQAQFPTSYYYTNPLFYSSYGYFNSIDGYLLGYLPFTPFLGPAAASAYNLAGIPTYPYVTSPYQTTFPYTTLPGTIIPYARFDYPTYVYGSPDYYLSWVLLQ